MGESFLTCAERETLEETGLRVKGAKVIAVTNDVFDADSKHYITLFVRCMLEDADTQPQVSRQSRPVPPMPLFLKMR
jgi:8-oxo-dGTP diphosphatase